MFCTRCGHQMQESDRFCAQCGKPTGMPPGEALAAEPERPKRALRRITSRKKIAGVCAGFADYFEMDLTLMRIIFLALAILPPAIGAITYLIAWIAMPKDTDYGVVAGRTQV